MTYPDGTEIRMGDRLRLGGRPGRVVFSIDRAEYPPSHPEAEWAYLRQGAMIEVEGIGLIHLSGAPDEDLEFLGRG